MTDWTWIDNQQKPVERVRVVTKGRKKGWLEVWYLKRIGKDCEPVMRKKVVARLIGQEDQRRVLRHDA